MRARLFLNGKKAGLQPVRDAVYTLRRAGHLIEVRVHRLSLPVTLRGDRESFPRPVRQTAWAADRLTGRGRVSAEGEATWAAERSFRSAAGFNLRLLGHPESVLLSGKFIDIVHTDDQATTLAEVEKLGRGETTHRFCKPLPLRRRPPRDA